MSDAPEARSAIGALAPPQQKSGGQSATGQHAAGRWSPAYVGHYDRCGALTAVVASFADEGSDRDGDPLAPTQVLFFHEGRFVGTADPCAFGRAEVKSVHGDTVVVQYRWPRGQETATTMSGSANVKYRWAGERVERLDPIPDELYNIVGCTR